MLSTSESKDAASLGATANNKRSAGDKMKNRQKSRSGCRTCKLRRLRCDETKPGCRNCAQKGFECPGYQQRLQWSTKHERPTTTKASGPANFTQLVTAVSKSIVSKPSPPAEGSTPEKDKTSIVVQTSAERLTVPCGTFSAATSPWASASPSSVSSVTSTPSPPPQFEDSTARAEPQAALVPVPSSVIASVVAPAVAPVVLLKEEEPGTPEADGETHQLGMLEPVVDIPTFLIEHWFKSVCPSWSALDSPANPYRQLTAKLWHSSSPVYYSLQAISAASLVERLPHVIKDVARSAPQNAFDAIRKELCEFSTGRRPKFPTELLLALFCLSSSMCWMESRQLGQKFVRQARAVLRSLDACTLDSTSQQLLDFFNGCLVYEEMLRSVVSEDDMDFEHMLSWPEPAIPQPLIPAVPHPWSGVSPNVVRLFGKAMALCRRSRTRWRHNDGTSYRILQGAMKDIEDATRVEESLLLGQQLQPLPLPQSTGREHDLQQLTEAYRLCALLQLYETFPDLSAKRIPVLKDTDGSMLWETCVTPLALHVTDVLSTVPAGSLSCIQPLLCLCAGSGLRFDSKVPLGTGESSYLLGADSKTPTMATPISPGSEFASINPGISEVAIKTSRARGLIMDRLDQLELCLPPKPIGVAKQLMRAVWSAYDEEIGLGRRTHWLDVMSYTGLHSLFG